MSGYALDNSWEHANRRLALLEQMLDPMTQRRIKMLGVGQGARCLEVAAGSGSIAKWLCEQVGQTGSVMATDINTTLLDEIRLPNLATSALPLSRLELALQLLKSPDLWAFGGGNIAVWGQRSAA